MIKELHCKVIIITSKNTKLNKLDIEKYNSTYDNLSIYYDETYHDRYFIIDNNKIKETIIKDVIKIIKICQQNKN